MTSKDKPFKQILIVGCGDIGLRVAKTWKNEGQLIYALARSEESLDRCRQQHLMTIPADLDEPTSLTDLPTRDALVYYFAPPPRSGTEDSRVTHFLSAIKENNVPAHIVYISTSGIYGDQQGELITEETPPRPQVDRAHRRFNAEQQFTSWAKENNVTVTILRVGGIYGPGRLPIQRIKDQVPMVHEHLAPSTNRIHADDLAQVCVAAAIKDSKGEIFNVSDGTNSNMTEYFNTIADHCGLPRPPLVDWDEAEKTISEGMLSYLRESRRMDNSKMLKILGVELMYPNLKEGLQNCRC